MSGRIVARYDYTNSKGDLRLRKLRFDPKGFLMRSWDSDREKWRNGVSDERQRFWMLALYKLPELVAALRVDVPAWWCEGEKDAETLLRLGLTATTTPNPSELWDDQCRWFTKFRSQSEVMLVLDNDLHGGWWGWERYTGLLRLGVAPDRIHVLAPPYRFNDVTDMVEAGRSPSDMRRVDLARLEKAAHAYTAARARSYTRRRTSLGPSGWQREVVKRGAS
ncbi:MULTISPECIES: hypothetical protein [unclassified Nocardioides]|uniref:hypothetical protein n=1 Tax=unclassified Nocardioides TaxID=2615069 RepID=UPI0036161F63